MMFIMCGRQRPCYTHNHVISRHPQPELLHILAYPPSPIKAPALSLRAHSLKMPALFTSILSYTFNCLLLKFQQHIFESR